jgi:hypothetical protein
MSLHLPALYHWSPGDRRKQIIRRGLIPGSRPTVSSDSTVGGADESGDGRHMVCLSADAATAWTLSGGLPWLRDVPSWDLWQVHIDEGDEVHILPFWGRGVMEIRVANRIPKSRVLFLATRKADGNG